MNWLRIAIAALCVVGSFQVSASADASDEEQRLIGWEGETYSADKKDKKQQNGPARKEWIETISWKPRAFVYHGFMSHEEADHMVALGSRRVSQSMVVDSATGMAKTDPIRTSYGAVFGLGEDPVIASIEERIGEWTHIPPNHGENIQILRYMDGQKYDSHWDWFENQKQHSAFLANGNRIATVLMYLGEVEEGGETWLPLADAIDEDAQKLQNASACVKQGLAVRAIKGDALMFFDMDPLGQKGDRRALHASCPTLKGVKWTATKWIHSQPYSGKYDALEKASRCTDEDPSCAKRVKAGQCYKNMTQMVGPAGLCRKSCDDCSVCPKGDILCQRRNVRSQFAVNHPEWAALAAKAAG